MSGAKRPLDFGESSPRPKVARRQWVEGHPPDDIVEKDDLGWVSQCGKAYVLLKYDGECGHPGCFRPVKRFQTFQTEEGCEPPSALKCELHTSQTRCLSCARMVLCSESSSKRHVQECVDCPGVFEPAFASAMLTPQEALLALSYVQSRATSDDFADCCLRNGIKIHASVAKSEERKAYVNLEAAMSALCAAKERFACVMRVPDNL